MVSRIKFRGNVAPLSRLGGLSDALDPITHVYVKSSSLIVDIAKHYLAVSVKSDGVWFQIYFFNN